MDCRECREFLVELDNQAELPESIHRHILECAACRDLFHRFNALSDVWRTRLVQPSDTAFTESIMAAVRTEASSFTQLQRGPFRNWIIAGTVLLVGLFGLRFSDVMNWLRATLGPGVDVAMGLILGVFLTGYICILVGSNLARVQRVFRLRS